MYQIKLPHDSNLRYLAMVYFLPEDFIASCPTLRKLPRNLREITQSSEMIELIKSEQFLNEIADATAALAFPHFGFSGWKEDYSGYSPIWKLSYALPLWIKYIGEITEWNLAALLSQPAEQDIPFFDRDFVIKVMEIAVKRAIEEHNWQPILDAIKKMPCEEDYEPRKSRARIDWHRKWYHTRSKTKSISLEEQLEDPNSGIFRLGDKNKVSLEEQVESRDYVMRFKKQLTVNDRKILEMRMDGYKYEEIAQTLGYKNHSGVIKRVQAIGKAYKQYEIEQNQ